MANGNVTTVAVQNHENTTAIEITDRTPASTGPDTAELIMVFGLLIFIAVAIIGGFAYLMMKCTAKPKPIKECFSEVLDSTYDFIQKPVYLKSKPASAKSPPLVKPPQKIQPASRCDKLNYKYVVDGDQKRHIDPGFGGPRPNAVGAYSGLKVEPKPASYISGLKQSKGDAFRNLDQIGIQKSDRAAAGQVANEAEDDVERPKRLGTKKVKVFKEPWHTCKKEQVSTIPIKYDKVDSCRIDSKSSFQQLSKKGIERYLKLSLFDDKSAVGPPPPSQIVKLPAPKKDSSLLVSAVESFGNFTPTGAAKSPRIHGMPQCSISKLSKNTASSQTTPTTSRSPPSPTDVIPVKDGPKAKLHTVDHP